MPVNEAARGVAGRSTASPAADWLRALGAQRLRGRAGIDPGQRVRAGERHRDGLLFQPAAFAAGVRDASMVGRGAIDSHRHAVGRLHVAGHVGGEVGEVPIAFPVMVTVACDHRPPGRSPAAPP